MQGTPSASVARFSPLASDVHREVLPNGLTVLVKEVYPSEVVSVGLWARVGSLHEDDDVAGASHFLEHMLFKGTPDRPVGTISQQVHGLGGYMNAFTSYDCTCYWMVLPSRHLEIALDIQMDALLHSVFDADEIRREADVILDELRMYQDRPASFCHEHLMALLFPTSPYGRPIIGHPSVIAGMTRPTLVRWYQEHYRPSNLTLVVTGDVDIQRVMAAAHPLGGMPDRPARPGTPPHDGAPGPAERRDLRGPIHSGHLHLGFQAPPVLSPDSYACDVLASLLGSGRSSRLYQALRERRGLVTHIGSAVSAERDAGVFSIEAVYPPGRGDEVLQAIDEEIALLQEAPVSTAELQKAHHMVEAAYLFSQETVEGQGRRLGYGEMLGDYRLAEQYVEHLYQVTAEEVTDRARRYLRLDHRGMVTYEPMA